MKLEDLEETRACVIYKASVEIRKILEEARKACVLDLVFEFKPLLIEILENVGDHYGLTVRCYDDLADNELLEPFLSVTRDA